MSGINLPSEKLIKCLQKDLSVEENKKRQKIIRQIHNDKLSIDEQKLTAEIVNERYANMEALEKELLLNKRKIAFQNLDLEQQQAKKKREI